MEKRFVEGRTCRGELHGASAKARVYRVANGVLGNYHLETVPNLPEKNVKECLDAAKKFIECYGEHYDLSSRSKYADMRELAKMIPSTFVNGQIIEKGIFALQINTTETGYLLKWGYSGVGGYKFSRMESVAQLTVAKNGAVTDFTREPHYLAESAEVNITPKQAIKIAMSNINFSEVYACLKKYSIHTTVKVVSVDVQLELLIGFFVNNTWAERGNDPYALYPIWDVRFYFDKKFPFNGETL